MGHDELIASLKERVNNRLDSSRFISDEDLMAIIEDEVFNLSAEQYLTASRKKQLVRSVYSIFRGLDVLQPLIDDSSITEIMINSHDEIFIERNGEIQQIAVKFESPKKLEDIIQKIVGEVNRIVNESSPIVDARLQDGSRVNVVLPPIALKGPTMTIRKFPEKPLTIQDLINIGSLSAEAADFLKMLVTAKYNIFISGGTGCGKTTFLNALSNFIPADQRIVTIEDSAELQIKTVPNLVSMETRNANTEDKGEINMRYLIKTSLRMRPDRIIVGEVRGPEALDMLQAMNTGHDGSLSTGHANNIADMLSRLETMVLSASPLPLEAIRQQICSGIDIMIHLARLRDRSRRVMEICELTGMAKGDYQLNPLYRFVEEGEDDRGRVLGRLMPTGNLLNNLVKAQMAGIKDLNRGLKQ
ncbi:MAG: CpaF family protein [Syntrophomonadaceae bacterium]